IGKRVRLTYDADDGQPALRILVVVEPHALSDGISVRPELPGHRLVDDGNRRPVCGVALVEVASTSERNPHGVEETLAHDVEAGWVPVVRTGVWLFFYSEGLTCSFPERWVGEHG